MRKICVSTAIVGWPKAMLSTTLAVLRPTPGSLTSSSRSSGTSPPWSRISASRQRDDVLRLVAPQPDGADVVADRRLAERQHLLRRVGHGKQRPRRLVDAGIGRLRRQHHGDQQREGVDVFEFALRLRPLHREAAEDLVAPPPACSANGPRSAAAAAWRCEPSRRRVLSRRFSAWDFPSPLYNRRAMSDTNASTAPTSPSSRRC